MKTTIILAPGANNSELLRSLAQVGKNSINVRILSTLELAKTSMYSSGQGYSEREIDANERLAIISRIIRNEPDFINANHGVFDNVAWAIDVIRSSVIAENELSEIENKLSQATIFKNKSKTLMRICREYISFLEQKKLVDEVSIVKKAFSSAKPMDASFVVIKEFPLTALERGLMEKLSSGEVKEISLQEFYGLEDCSLKIESYKNCYGVANEVETILNEIYSEGKPIDTCTVAVTDVASYGQVFYDFAVMYDIPMTFGMGVAITNSYPADLLKLYYDWTTVGYFGGDYLNAMLHSPAFKYGKWKKIYDSIEISDDLRKLFAGKTDEQISREIVRTIVDIVGRLHLTNDCSRNKKIIDEFKKGIELEKKHIPSDNKEYKQVIIDEISIELIRTISSELTLEPYKFINKYAVKRFSNVKEDETEEYNEVILSDGERLIKSLDESAFKRIVQLLKDASKEEETRPFGEVVEEILAMNICQKNSTSSSLHVTSVSGALSTVRTNLFVAGLDSGRFPGMPTENYLLLDTILDLFGDNAGRYKSQAVVDKKISDFMSLIDIASARGAKIYVSFSGLDVSELKKKNASSMLYRLYKKEKNTDEVIKFEELENAITKVEYFEPMLSFAKHIGMAYVEDKKLISSGKKTTHYSGKIDFSSYRFSSTSIESYFSCPRQFLLKSLMKIYVNSEEDLFSIIDANEYGTMVHFVMEVLGNNTMSEQEFMDMCSDIFDSFICKNPPIIKEKIGSEKTRFLKMMKYAFASDKAIRKTVVSHEEDITCEHQESKIVLRGLADRIEEYPGKKYAVVDYKTGKTKAKEDDVHKCLQVMIYAYLMEQTKKYDVTHGEYRYLKSEKTVKCDYSDEHKAELTELLKEVRSALDNFEFAKNFNLQKEPCIYCDYKEYCKSN